MDLDAIAMRAESNVAAIRSGDRREHHLSGLNGISSLDDLEIFTSGANSLEGNNRS